MKIEQLLNEHKKGIKAIKYAKKPVPIVGAEAQKKKAKAAPPKTELEKHSKLSAKLEAKRPDRPLPKTDLKVGDDVVADTSKEDYPGGHKERRGKVTRVGEKGVHIKTSDSDEPEWHPYKIVKKHSVSEDWTQKYKKSINCSHPKGFSQKAHCAGKKKHNESIELEMTCPDCGMCQTHGNNMMEVKQRLDAKCWKGKHKEGTKIKGGIRVNNCVPNEGVAEAEGEEDYYYRVRHQTKKDIELEMPPKMWDAVGPKYGTYEEAKAEFDQLKDKHPHEKFTYTRHPRISHMGGKPSQSFPEGVAEGTDDIAQAKERLAHLQKVFDPDYEYSDDHSVWKKHNAIRQEINQLKKIISQDVKESKPKNYDSEGNPLGGGYDEYDTDKKSWTVVVNGKAWKTFDNEKQAYNAADTIQQKYGKKTRVVSEDITETARLSTREKFKRSLKRAGYDPDAGAKRIEDLLAKQKKEREEREKQEQGTDMKEAKQPEAPKPRNFVAKNAKTAGAGAHKDAKKAAKEVRGQKHKNKEIAESEMGKIVDYKPGQTATLSTGPGMTTIVDLKKNPTSLTKDPATGKLKLMGPQATGTPAATASQSSTIKPGDAVEIGKVAEDILRLAGLR